MGVVESRVALEAGSVSACSDPAEPGRSAAHQVEGGMSCSLGR